MKYIYDNNLGIWNRSSILYYFSDLSRPFSLNLTFIDYKSLSSIRKYTGREFSASLQSTSSLATNKIMLFCANAYYLPAKYNDSFSIFCKKLFSIDIALTSILSIFSKINSFLILVS